MEIKLNGEAHERRLRAFGKEFGYPSCCIDEFVEDMRNGVSPAMTRGVYYMGFVPCRSHADAITNGKMSFHDLISNRTHRLPFPHNEAAPRQLKRSRPRYKIMFTFRSLHRIGKHLPTFYTVPNLRHEITDSLMSKEDIL